jgi:YjjG family noncanonical pyrimidine nucleotidase
MQFSNKKDLFFDLDHTLWDFDKNAEETLHELFSLYRFENFGLKSADAFIESYARNNKKLWALYHHGQISKEKLRLDRFKNTFEELGVDSAQFPAEFEEDYIRLCPHKTHVFPHTYEILAYLQEKYKLHLISNGFKEASYTKIEKAKLDPFFSTIVISEVVGIHKPDPAIFYHAVDQAQTSIDESIMIGDSLEADIQGAQNAGMDAIFFNPNHSEVPTHVSHSIASLKELEEWL